MVKSIIKEIFIIILLIIAILFVLAVLFYDYRPSTKNISSISSKYNLPAEMQEELEQTITTTQNIVKTYKVDSDDLYNYQKSDDYEKGNINPFGAISSNTVDTTDEKTDTGGFLNMVK